MEASVQAQLCAMGDPVYRQFQAKLIPTADPAQIIGVRIPQLRSYAKTIKNTPKAEAFLAVLPHTYYDENNLHGLLVSQMQDFDDCIAALDRFLPYVDNWATCDIISPKVLQKQRQKLQGHIVRWLASDHTYTVRFGIEMLLSFYLDQAFEVRYHDMVAALRSEAYYINMMIAWYFATALAKQYDQTLPYLTAHRLDVWTHNKAIQKARESYRITPEQKTYLKTLKR